FEAIRHAYSGLLHLGLQHRAKLIAGFLGFTLLSFGLAPYLGQDFFPNVDGGQIKIHVRAQTGTRIEETTKLADRIGEAIHKIIPADELDGIVDNIGLSPGLKATFEMRQYPGRKFDATLVTTSNAMNA